MTALAAIAIPDEVLAAIYAHALAAFPDECCGYLTGSRPDGGAGSGIADEPSEVSPVGVEPDPAGRARDKAFREIDAVVPCRNAQIDGVHPIVPDRGADAGFVIEGAELLRFARSFDGDRPARVVYHSHTNGQAYFSTVDRRMAAGPAYPVQHVVIGVVAGAITEVAQFAWSPAAADHVEVARWRVGAPAATGARSDGGDRDGGDRDGAPR
jgi:[CysO sulfur-carrier protein]-S-L-cysteine hydrolase